MRLNLRSTGLQQGLAAVAALAFAIGSASALTYTWKGTTSTNWSTTSNWLAPNGMGGSNGAFTNRLDVNNGANNPLVYTSAEGTTIYGSAGAGAQRGLAIGSGAGGSGTMTITGGSFITTNGAGGDIIGNTDNNTGILNVSGGSFTCNSTISLGLGGGTGRKSFLNVNSGTCTLPTLACNATMANINLNGGTLAVNAIAQTFGASTNNFNGGTLQARTNSTSFIGNLSRVNVRDGGAIIDTAGFNVTVLPALQHSDLTGDAAIDGGLTKLSAGTLTLNGAPTYTGPTRVNSGTLVERLPISSIALIVAEGAKYSVGVTNTVWPMDSAALTNSALDFNYGSWAVNGYTNAVMYVTNLAISGSVTCNVAGTGFPVTNLTLLSYGTKTGDGSFTLGTLPAGAAATLVDDGANVILQITAGSIQNLIWSVGDGIWQTNGGANWNGNTATYLEYPSGVNDVVTFNDTASGNVTIANQVNPSAITVDVTANTYTFSGAGSIIGTNGITKLGTSTLTINNSNSFTGPVTISGGGTLFVLHPNALGATNGGTVVSGPANTLELGDLGAAGVTVAGETVTINGTGVGGARGALRGQNSTSSNIWAGPVIIGTTLSRIGTEDSGNLTVSGPITDGGLGYALLLRPGDNGILTLAGTGSSYSFTRTFGGSSGTGMIKLGANDALSTNRIEFGSGTLDLNGFSQTVGGINNDNNTGPFGTINNNGGSASTFTVNTGTNNFSSPANIQDGTGTVGLVKLGSSALTLTGATLTYSGATAVNEGQLNLATVSTMNSSITVAGGAKLAGEPITTNSLTLNANATLIVDPNSAGSLTSDTVNAPTAPVYVGFSASPPTNAPTLILTATTSMTGIDTNFQAVGVRGGSFFLTNSDTQLMFAPSAAAGAAIVWKGNDATNPSFWDVTTTTNWSKGGSPDLFYTGDAVTFNDTATTFNVAVQSTVSPASATFNNSVSNYVVSGGAISGSATVSKSGSGTVTLASANSYSGQTTVNDGVLAIQTSSSLGLTSAGTVISGSGTLDFGAATTANSIDLAAEVVTISGNGSGGVGAIINNSPLQQFNALRQLVLAGNASVGGPGVSLDGNQQPISTGGGRWDMRGPGNAMDMAGNTLTKVGSNFVSLVGTTVSNPGNIIIEAGILGLQSEGNLNGSAANSLTIQSNGILNFYQSYVAPTWTLNLTNGSRFWTQSGTGTGTNVWAGPVALNGAAVLDANGGTMIISGNVSGSGSFTKVGPNTTSLYGDNTYSGGTTITNGVIWAGTNTALGTGPVTINPSAIRLVVADGQTITNDIIINGGGVSFRGLIENSGVGNATLAGSTITVNGPVSGGGHFASAVGGTLTVSNAIVATTNINVVSRIGTVIFAGGGSYAGFSAAEGTVRLGANNGLCTTSLVSIATSAAANLDLAGFNQTLSGIQRTTGSTAVITNSSTVTNSTLTFGGTSSYSGLIKDAGVAGSQIALVVNGGDLTLSGANSYSGGSTVTNGTLRINTTTAAGTGAVEVQNGGTLTGNGIVSGATTTDADSTLSPGNNGVGTLTFSSGLTIGGNVLVQLDKSLAQSNDLVNVTGSLSKVGAGTLVVSNLGPALVAGDTFTLFSQPVVNGNQLTIVGPAGVTFTNDLVNSGSIAVLSVTAPPTIPTTPTNITFSVTSSNITIGWPSNYTGWTLQTQTNSRSIGLKTNWFDVAGSELTNALTFPINKVDPTVFFRLIYTNAP